MSYANGGGVWNSRLLLRRENRSKGHPRSGLIRLLAPTCFLTNSAETGSTYMRKNAQNRRRFQRALFKNRTHKCSLVTKETFGFRVVFHCRLTFRIFGRFHSVLFIIGETWK